MFEADYVLFDLDGTLTDPKEGIIKSFLYVYESLGIAPPPANDLIRYIGPPLTRSFSALFGPDRVEAAVNFYRRRYIDEECMFENFVYPEIPKVLSRLKLSGKALFISTSKIRLVAERIANRFNISQYFKKIYGAEFDNSLSDKDELIAYILKDQKIPPSQAIIVGDREDDIIGAKRNGLRAIGACWGYGSRVELKEAGAVALASKPDDLLTLLLPA
ncbi:MAG: HAD hydrolase-like protein [Alphaproteobacteria bacterium]|nr:HAD hydrolase-like protein [Alphaproteobacteria bacterium]